MQLARVKRLGSDAQKELNNFWLSGNGQSLCQALVHNYFPLTVSPTIPRTETYVYYQESHQHHAQGLGGILSSASCEAVCKQPDCTLVLQMSYFQNEIKSA